MASVRPTVEVVTNPSPQWVGDAALAGGAASLALIAEHIGLWDPPYRLPPPANYAAGTFTLGMTFLVWALRHRQQQALEAWLAAAIIASMGGGTVILAYYWREVAQQLRDGATRGGWLNGQIRQAVHGAAYGDDRSTAPRDR